MRRIALFLLTSLAIALAACGPATVNTPTTVPTTEPTLPPTAELGPTLPPTTPVPAGVLIDYTREGGFDGTTLHLVINSDGTASLDGTNYVATAQWTIEADKLELLKAQISQPEFATLPLDPHPEQLCNDCFIYTINAQTPQGVKTLRFDDADISTENTPPLYQGLNGTLAAVIASAPTPTIPDDPKAVLPDDTLLILHQEGGIAFNQSTLTIKTDGTAMLEGSDLSAPVQWTLSAEEMSTIQKSLAIPEIANVKTDGMVNCADCFVYSLTFRSPAGVRYFKVDDADFMDNALPQVYDVIVLLNTVRKNAPKSI